MYKTFSNFSKPRTFAEIMVADKFLISLTTKILSKIHVPSLQQHEISQPCFHNDFLISLKTPNFQACIFDYIDDDDDEVCSEKSFVVLEK